MNDDLTDQKEMRIANPPDRAYLTFILLVSAFGFTLGLFQYFEDEESVFKYAIFFFFASLIAFAILYRELIHRPKSVGLSNDGVIFYYYLVTKKIRWEIIKSVYSGDSDPEVSYGFFKRRGGMMVNGGQALYSLSYEAAHMIREAYRKNVGQYPPDK